MRIAHGYASTTDTARVTELVQSAEAADGASALDEAATLALGRGAGPTEGADAFLARESDRVVGFALVLPGNGSLVVDPGHRRKGIGSALLGAVLDSGLEPPPEFWAHGPHPGAAPLAERFGLVKVRELWRMRRTLADSEGPGVPADSGSAGLPDWPTPAGFTIRTFEPGDEEGVLATNAAAFAHHPEQGRLTRADLDERMAQSWFDPAGLFVAVDGDDRIVGFHWTKVHAAHRQESGRVGEIYVLGIRPDVEARGLGKALAVAGLRRFVELGLPAAMLYTEADNIPAIGLYERLGFRHAGSDVMYARP